MYPQKLLKTTGILYRGECNYLHGYQKIFSHSLYMLCPSLPGLAASIIVLTTFLVAATCSLQQLAYVGFAVATIPYLLVVLTSYHTLSHKVIP